MTTLNFFRVFSEILFEPSNEIVDSWCISNNPILLLVILSSYLIFIYKIGPSWMRNRKPYELKEPIMIYNILQVVACIAMIVWVRQLSKILGRDLDN